MLPSKGYFNSLECPFYLSSVQCLRPYCHFKHPKRSTKTEVNQEKVEESTKDYVGVSTATIISIPVEEKPVVAPVKHIPIAYIPTKPSAVSVNIKHAKSMYVPSVKKGIGRTCIVGSTDYHPSSVMDSSEKTYSRYSYEKGHDSGDEIMENYKNLIETNTIGKLDDGSKSGYDEETDYYPEEPVFSPPNSPDEEDIEFSGSGLSRQDCEFKSEEPDDRSDKDLKIKKKRKYAEINETKAINEYTKNHDDHFTKIKTENNEDNISANGSPKRIKTEKTIDISPKKIKTEKGSNDSLLKTIKKIEDSNHAASSESKKSERKDTKNKDKKHSSNSHKHSSNSHKHSENKSKEHSNKKVSSDSKKHSSDKNDSKSTEKHSGKSHSSDKKLSSSSKKHRSDGKFEKKVISSDSKKSSSESSQKHSSESKIHSAESKIHSSESKIHLAESKIHLAESKIHSSESKIHSSESKINSSESKRHSLKDKKHSSGSKKPEKEPSSTSKNLSDKKHSVNKNCKKLSSSNKHSSENKKNSSSHSKKKQNEKVKSSSKSKEDPVKNKTADKKHSEGSRKDSNKKKDYHKSSSSSSKHRHDKNKSNRSGNHEDRRSKNRKHSESSESVISSNDVKETILISDSSDSEERERKSLNNYSPVGVDEIFGSSASSDDNRLSDHGGNYHDVSDSENDNEYTPMPIFSSRDSPAYKPSSSSSNKIDDETNYSKNFKTAPQVSTEDSYKPAQTVSKVRIAHVPNVSSLLSAKTMFGTGKTVPPTVEKLAKCMDMLKSRVTARTLNQNTSNHRPKPQVTVNLNSVVAVNIRQPGLNNIYDELIKFVDYDDAYRRAVEEENEICNVATNPQSYRNRIALCILRIRKSKGAVDVVQKERITSSSIPDYTYGVTLYECFSKYLLKPEDYVLHGYPLEIPDKPGCAYIDKNSFFRSKKVDLVEGGSFKKCVNCGKEYAINEETGIPLTKNNCHHHWGKLIGMRQGKIYTCCKSEVGSDPCHTSMYHVTELKNEDCLEGFVKTQPYPSDADPNKAGIYAMDCEMCFTTQGRDIVRASLLAVDNESFYDVLIKPKYPILDYCTRFSGITEEKLVSVTTTLEEVQRFLLKTINDKTILVGHSLENDLKALKLLHFNVVDTSLMFPHKEGFPVKCALRTLCSRILGTAIQTGENGHDSLEDARGCLQLVLHQVREDAKSRKPRVVKQLKTNK